MWQLPQPLYIGQPQMSTAGEQITRKKIKYKLMLTMYLYYDFPPILFNNS